MATRFVPIDRDTPLLLDLRQVKVNTRGTGSEQYPPHTLLGLLLYSYATGTFGSRRIERSPYDRVPVRRLTADTHPDPDTPDTGHGIGTPLAERIAQAVDTDAFRFQQLRMQAKQPHPTSFAAGRCDRTATTRYRASGSDARAGHPGGWLPATDRESRR